MGKLLIYPILGCQWMTGYDLKRQQNIILTVSIILFIIPPVAFILDWFVFGSGVLFVFAGVSGIMGSVFIIVFSGDGLYKRKVVAHSIPMKEPWFVESIENTNQKLYDSYKFILLGIIIGTIIGLFLLEPWLMMVTVFFVATYLILFPYFLAQTMIIMDGVKVKRNIEYPTIFYFPPDEEIIKELIIELKKRNISFENKDEDRIELKDLGLDISTHGWNCALYLSLKPETNQEDVKVVMEILDKIIDKVVYYSKDWRAKNQRYFGDKKGKPIPLTMVGVDYEKTYPNWFVDGLEFYYIYKDNAGVPDKKKYKLRKATNGLFYIDIGEINYPMELSNEIWVKYYEAQEKLNDDDKKSYEMHKKMEEGIKELKKSDVFLGKSSGKIRTYDLTKYHMQDLMKVNKYLQKKYIESFLNPFKVLNKKESDSIKKKLKFVKTEKLKTPLGKFDCEVYHSTKRLNCSCMEEDNKLGVCSSCHGDKKCSVCKGTGNIEFLKKQCEICEGTGVCQACDGSGVCNNCKGTGKSKFRMNSWFWYEKTTGIRIRTLQKSEKDEPMGTEDLIKIKPKNVLNDFKITSK
jgi:hypothetical protein